MQKLEVGQLYPYHNRADGVERCVAEVNEAFFDVLFYSSQAAADAAMWRKGKLKYALFVARHVPFFILDFPDDRFNLDVSINFLKVQDEQADEWLNSDANVVNLFLIDARTNIIHGMRMISIRGDIAEQIRDVCEKQDEAYTNYEEVDKAIHGITNRYTTNQMLETCQKLDAN